MSKPTSKKLRLEWQRFADVYLENGMNQTRAYMAVYSDSSYETAMANASDLLRNTKILEYITQQLEKYGMGKIEALARLARQARGDIDDLINEKGSIDLEKARALSAIGIIKKIKVTEKILPTLDGNETVLERTIDLELYSSQRALEIILKAHGALIDKQDTKLEIVVREEGIPDEQRVNLVTALLERNRA